MTVIHVVRWRHTSAKSVIFGAAVDAVIVGGMSLWTLAILHVIVGPANRERAMIRKLLLVSLLLATPASAEDRSDRDAYFAFLRAVGASELPHSPAAWKVFACAWKAAKPISDREPTLPSKFWPVEAEAVEALGQCKSEMDAIPQHSVTMQQVVVDMIARFREERRQPIVCSTGVNLNHPCGTPLKR